MRYTEARLAAPALELLADIGKNTVDFTENFDGTLDRAAGVAFGPAQPAGQRRHGHRSWHGDQYPAAQPVRDRGCLRLHARKMGETDDINVDDLMQFVEGPDFPTGGIIIEQKARKALMQLWQRARARHLCRPMPTWRRWNAGKSRIIVTELPYQVNKVQPDRADC